MNTSAVSNTTQATSQTAGNQSPNPGTSSLHKEREAPAVQVSESVSQIKEDVELPEEVEKAGVIAHKETFEIPPDLKKIGMQQAGSAVTAAPQSLPGVILPVADNIVYIGIHAKVTDALRWLAAWCVRRLKKAHLMLKKVHGKIIRIKFN